MISKTVSWNIVSVIFVLAISVWGNPMCRIRFRTEVICAAGNNDYRLQRGLVSDNNNIITITLKDCRITEVDHDAFKNVYKLQSIDLSMNKISILEVGVFDDVANLTGLRLSKNLLTSLPLGLFDNLPNLQRLDISDNKINILEPGIFHHLPNLILLELSGMTFLGKDLNSSLFSQNPNIKYLHFSNSNMFGAPDDLLNAFQDLTILGLDNCSLTEVPKFATVSNLKTLKQLRLELNKIVRLEDPNTFVNLVDLVSLELMGNLIENLNGNIFKPLSNLKYLVLSINRIKQIPGNLFHDMASLRSIDLSRNLIEAMPVTVFRGTSLASLDLSRNRISFLDRHFCTNISCCIRRLTTFYFDKNPFQCACLHEIINEVKELGITYQSDTHIEENAECYTTNDVNCIRPEDESYAGDEKEKMWPVSGHSRNLNEVM